MITLKNALQKLVFSMIFFSVLSIPAGAQSVYRFKYQMKTESDNTAYEAFFINMDNGSGSVRIKFKSPANGEDVLVDLGMLEEYPEMASGDLNYTKINYRLMAPQFIKGSNTTKFSLPMYWFKKDAASGLFEPWGATNANGKPDAGINAFESVEYFEKKDLSKDLVLQYFVPTDVFYQNLFVTKTRALSADEKNYKIFLMVVTNTNDEHIGVACKRDKERVSATFGKLSKVLGIKMDTVMIWGSTYNKANVDKAIDDLKPGPNDIVVFYYSGHGFRKPKDSRRYPYMDLRVKIDKTYMENSLSVEDVYNRLSRKKARLTLVLSDCCNTAIQVLRPEGVAPPLKKGFGLDWNLENVRSLFLDPKPVSILATAADVDQRAGCNPEFGAFFSYYIMQSLEEQMSYFSKKASWESMLENAKKQTINKALNTYCDRPFTPENICDQVPVNRVIR